MKSYVPYHKLSKKRKRELNARKRETWRISPVTRKPPDPKAYKRQNRKIRIEEE